MTDAKFLMAYLKDSELIRISIRRKAFCKRLPVIGLDAFYWEWKCFDKMLCCPLASFTRSASGLRLRISMISLISSGVC